MTSLFLARFFCSIVWVSGNGDLLATGTCRKRGDSALKCSAVHLQCNATAGESRGSSSPGMCREMVPLGMGCSLWSISNSHWGSPLLLNVGKGEAEKWVLTTFSYADIFFFWGNYHVASHQTSICMLCCNIRPAGLVPTVDAATAAAYTCILIRVHCMCCLPCFFLYKKCRITAMAMQNMEGKELYKHMWQSFPYQVSSTAATSSGSCEIRDGDVHWAER